MNIRLFRIFSGAMVAGLVACGSVNAWAAGQSNLSCDLYGRLEQQCNCKGTDNYLISYGRRYCDRFLNSTGWTAAGAKWRDQTLTCLQTSLIQALPRDVSRACDCGKIRDIAWQTHVRCYTQPSASVCQLPFSDLAKIYEIVDASDLFDPRGFSQALAIANACVRERN
jgi:hypothetical protein